MKERLKKDWKSYRDENAILVYQMGKVGSTSLEISLPGCVHFHSLYGNWPCHVQYEQMRGSLIGGIQQGAYDLMRRTAIRSRGKIKIITLVRDPYQRNLSTFFQHFPHWMYHFYTLQRYSKYEYLSSLFQAYDKAMDHTYPLLWFDNEFKKFTGVDIYSHPFDKQSGWSRIQEGKFDILLIKLEKINDAWGAIEDFAGTKLELVNANVSSDKWYSGVYKNFVKEYTPKQEYLDLLYHSKLVDHFYTGTEAEGFRDRANQHI